MKATAPNKIPDGTIGLADAFSLFCIVTTPDWDRLEAAAVAALAAVENCRTAPGEIAQRGLTLQKLGSKWQAAVDAMNEATRAAEIAFRNHLASGTPAAKVREPGTDIRSVLTGQDWTARNSFGVPGFHDNFVWTGDPAQPGPDAFSDDGKLLLPVFFESADFEKFLAPMRPTLARSDGPGPRSMKVAIGAELERWRAGGTVGLKAELRQHGWTGKRTRGAIALALHNWADKNRGPDETPPTARTIEQIWPDKIKAAYDLL
jgi:hypothetical protein